MNSTGTGQHTKLDDRTLARRQIGLLSIAEGFFESSILFALNKLHVFDTIGVGQKTVNEIAAAVGAEPATLSRLLNAGVAIKLLTSNDAVSFAVSEEWKPVLLRSSGDGYLGSWLNFLHYLSASMIDLDKAAAHGGPTVNLLGLKQHEDIHEFILAMHNYAVYRGRDLARFLDTSGCESLLDLGCGPGTYAFLLASANPKLSVYLLDLPEVLEVAREVAARYSIAGSVSYVPVDVTCEEIPGSYDIVLVSNTLHMLGEAESRKLLKRLCDHVNPGGSLVVQFQPLNENRMGGRWPVMVDLAQLCVTEHGRNHAVGETRKWMEDAGYEDIEFSPMGLLNTNGFLRGYRR